MMNIYKNTINHFTPWTVPLFIAVYLVFLPALFANHPVLALVIIFYPGLRLYTYLGYLVHENWHGYFGTKHRDTLAFIYGIIAGIDTQIYENVHAYHHKYVHTYQDIEFYPLGNISHLGFKRLSNFLELIFGLFYVSLLQLRAIKDSPTLTANFSQKKHYFSLFFTLTFYTFCGYGAFILGATPKETIFCYLILLWLTSFTLHIGQLLQHGNIIIDDDNIKECEIYTRNLRYETLLEKLFHFFTHNDCLEHTIHHTHPHFHNRPFPYAYQMPYEQKTISLSEFLQELKIFLLVSQDD